MSLLNDFEALGRRFMGVDLKCRNQPNGGVLWTARNITNRPYYRIEIADAKTAEEAIQRLLALIKAEDEGRSASAIVTLAGHLNARKPGF